MRFSGRDLHGRLSGIGRADGGTNQVGKAGDKRGGITDGGGHFELFDSGGHGLLAGLDIDFVEGFDVLGDERYRHNEQVFFAGTGQVFERLMQGRLEPFLAADAALIAQGVGVWPAAGGEHGGDGFLDVALVGIAAFDQTQGQAMGAENQVGPRGMIEMGERGGDAFGRA